MVEHLTQKGYAVSFKGDNCFIYEKPPNKMLLSRVNMKMNRMYPLIMNCGRHDTLFSQKETCLDDFWLWNFRFGHLHFGGLMSL
jgi:hypothetical protein